MKLGEFNGVRFDITLKQSIFARDIYLKKNMKKGNFNLIFELFHINGSTCNQYVIEKLSIIYIFAKLTKLACNNIYITNKNINVKLRTKFQTKKTEILHWAKFQSSHV